MRVPRPLAVAAAITSLLTMLSACTGVGGPAAGRTAAPVATLPALNAAFVKTAKVVPLTDPTRGIKIAVPSIRRAPALALGVQIVRNATVRSYLSMPGATALDLSWQVLASSDKVLGIALISRRTVNGTIGVDTTALWYDQETKRVFTSPALINPAGWDQFVAEVVHACRQDGGLDPEKARAALAQPATVWGSGPAITFDAEGNVVVEFDSAVTGGEPAHVRVAGALLTPLFSRLGKRARVAAMYPSSFDGTASLPREQEPIDGRDTDATHRPSPSVSRDCVADQCVALTFDDGPSPTTGTIVDVLRDAGVGATFFVVGDKIVEDPGALAHIALSGSEVQSHAWRHVPLSRYGTQGAQDSLTQAARAIESAAGLWPVVVRPPDGAVNERVQKAATGQGSVLVTWTIDTRDWESHDTLMTTQAAVQGAEPGAIILMSDLYPSTAAAVPEIIAQLKARGLTLVPVSELIDPNVWTADHPVCALPGSAAAGSC